MTIPPNTPSFTIMDYSKVQSAQLEILSFDIAGFVGYGALLYIYCVLLDGFVSTLLLLLTQLIIGIAGVRVHFSLGTKTRQKTQLIDPSAVESGWKLERVDLKLEDAEKIIEYAHSQIPEQDLKKIDDYNDIAWFMILIWSVLSSIAVNYLNADPRLCITGVLVTVCICLLLYINGYQSSNLDYLCDYLDHLEFFVLSRLSILNQVTNAIKKNIFVEWLSKNGKYILNDFGCIIHTNRNNNDNCSISYHLGLPSQMNERFSIKGKWEVDSQIPLNLKESLSISNWNIIIESSAKHTFIHFEHLLSEVSLGTMNISSINIDEVEKSSKEVLEILKKILNICIIN